MRPLTSRLSPSACGQTRHAALTLSLPPSHRFATAWVTSSTAAACSSVPIESYGSPSASDRCVFSVRNASSPAANLMKSLKIPRISGRAATNAAASRPDPWCWAPSSRPSPPPSRAPAPARATLRRHGRSPAELARWPPSAAALAAWRSPPTRRPTTLRPERLVRAARCGGARRARRRPAGRRHGAPPSAAPAPSHLPPSWTVSRFALADATSSAAAHAAINRTANRTRHHAGACAGPLGVAEQRPTRSVRRRACTTAGWRALPCRARRRCCASSPSASSRWRRTPSATCCRDRLPGDHRLLAFGVPPRNSAAQFSAAQFSNGRSAPRRCSPARSI